MICSQRVKTVTLRWTSDYIYKSAPSNDVLSDVVVLVEVEQLADLARSLGSQATRDGGVGQAWGRKGWKGKSG